MSWLSEIARKSEAFLENVDQTAAKTAKLEFTSEIISETLPVPVANLPFIKTKTDLGLLSSTSSSPSSPTRSMKNSLSYNAINDGNLFSFFIF